MRQEPPTETTDATRTEKGYRKMIRKISAVLAAGVSLTLAMGSAAQAQTTSPEARQKDKNNMRNLAAGLGALAAQQALKGKTTNALVIGAGAALAGKKYEDARKAQSREGDRRLGRYDDRYRYDDRRNDNRRYDDRYDRRNDSRDDGRYDSRYDDRNRDRYDDRYDRRDGDDDERDCDEDRRGNRRVATRFSDTRGRKLGHYKNGKSVKNATPPKGKIDDHKRRR